MVLLIMAIFNQSCHHILYPKVELSTKPCNNGCSSMFGDSVSDNCNSIDIQSDRYRYTSVGRCKRNTLCPFVMLNAPFTVIKCRGGISGC